MIVKKNFNPLKVISYTWQSLLYSLILSGLVFYLFEIQDIKQIALPFMIVGVLGTALAIFLGFRNSSSYGRWWEARQIWGALVNHSREYARMTINFVDVCIRANPDREGEMNNFKKELIYRHIAFVNALRLHLRKQESWEEIQGFLKKEEYDTVKQSQNKPNYINMFSGDCLRKGQDKGMLEWFHTFQIEGNLTQFAHHLGKCERIKNTPMPRQYHFFTRLFLYVFILFFPFGLIDALSKMEIAWAIIPITVIVAFVFSAIERTGAVNEDPFENRIQDIPMTALCNTIERDLREMLGEKELPPKLEPVDGYLF